MHSKIKQDPKKKTSSLKTEYQAPLVQDLGTWQGMTLVLTGIVDPGQPPSR